MKEVKTLVLAASLILASLLGIQPLNASPDTYTDFEFIQVTKVVDIKSLRAAEVTLTLNIKDNNINDWQIFWYAIPTNYPASMWAINRIYDSTGDYSKSEYSICMSTPATYCDYWDTNLNTKGIGIHYRSTLQPGQSITLTIEYDETWFNEAGFWLEDFSYYYYDGNVKMNSLTLKMIAPPGYQILRKYPTDATTGVQDSREYAQWTGTNVYWQGISICYKTETVNCYLSTNDVTIDGRWTTPDEWIDAAELPMVTIYQLGDKPSWITTIHPPLLSEGKAYTRVKSDTSYLYFLIDFVTDSDVGYDSTLGLGDNAYVAIDTQQNFGISPQTDDYMFMIHWTSPSASATTEYVGDGAQWAVTSVSGFSGQSSTQATNDPYSTTSHVIYEFKIPKSILPSSTTVGLSAGVYDLAGKCFKMVVHFDWFPTPISWLNLDLTNENAGGYLSSYQTFVNNAIQDQAYFIYPDYDPTHSKGNGAVAAALSDFTALGFVYGMLANTQVECLDTSSTYVTQSTGQPSLTDKSIVLVGGPVVHASVRYYETNRIAPVYYGVEGSTYYWYTKTGTKITASGMSASVFDVGIFAYGQDMFVVESFTDADGNNVYIIYGYGWKGSFAGGKFFKAVIYPNISSYTDSYYIFQWNDSNGDAFVDLNEISTTPIAQG